MYNINHLTIAYAIFAKNAIQLLYKMNFDKINNDTILKIAIFPIVCYY